jgi:hypothetical protein
MFLHHTEGALAFLKAELKILPTQDALWTTFADAVRTALKKVPAHAPARPDPSTTWPDRLAAREKALEAQIDVLRALRPAVATLYAGLTPEQRKMAEELAGGGPGMRM